MTDPTPTRAPAGGVPDPEVCNICGNVDVDRNDPDYPLCNECAAFIDGDEWAGVASND